ncbi:GNAT family N-acetyltransferase [Gordonia sp. CPCC 205333]|uniref:GNAT family N-acetyltransferase n=1 Tax=Gordonia sp. CPCC 205333 TaxID=3140790 RepID=UPI003AF34B70
MTEIRELVTPEEIRSAFGVFRRSLLGVDLRAIDPAASAEPGRYIGALDDTGIVGGTYSASGTLVVPGGAQVPHAAVTAVGVLPSHRRRGIARAMLTSQLSGLARRGDVVATLRASEALIYGRFGYGIANSVRSATIDRTRGKLRSGLPAGGEIRIADTAWSELLDPIHRRATWTGAITRHPGWWVSRAPSDSGPLRYTAVHRTEGVDDGYVHYRPVDPSTWFASRARTIVITDFVALTDAARAGLWRHLFDLDLVNTIEVETLPLDDPLPLFVEDERAVTLGPARDETWLRLIDVPAALSARTFAATAPATIAVIDEELPANGGTYRISGDGVAPTDSVPDVTVPVAELATTYLGGTRWWQLAAAGRLEVRDPAALARLDALFATDRLPYSGTFF